MENRLKIVYELGSFGNKYIRTHIHKHNQLSAKTSQTPTITRSTNKMVNVPVQFLLFYFPFFLVMKYEPSFQCMPDAFIMPLTRLIKSERDGPVRGGRWWWKLRTHTHTYFPLWSFFTFFYIYEKCIALTSPSHTPTHSPSLWSHAYVCVYKCQDTAADKDGAIVRVSRERY